MKKIALLIFISFTFLVVNAQKTCNKKEESLEDLNSIAKCSLDKSNKKKNQLRVRVSAKRRFLKKSSINKKLIKSLKLKKNLSSAELRKAKKFVAVDQVPTFKKCSALEGDERLDCFNSEMVKHIEKHFNYPNKAIINKIEGEVWVRFVIGKDGYVTNIKTYTKGAKKHQILEDEALRVVSYLPILEPGIKNGKPVSVKYGFPINFELDN